MMAAYFEVDAPKRLGSYITDPLFLQLTSSSVVQWKQACTSVPGPETEAVVPGGVSLTPLLTW